MEYVEKMHDKWLSFDHGEYTIAEIIQELDKVSHAVPSQHTHTLATTSQPSAISPILHSPPISTHRLFHPTTYFVPHLSTPSACFVTPLSRS